MGLSFIFSTALIRSLLNPSVFLSFYFIIPAHAGISFGVFKEIPACAGMTKRWRKT
jgi:hypothetical protein